MSALPWIDHGARLLVVVGPSGAGKDTLMRGWRARLGTAPVHFAQRVITREPDKNEPHESVNVAAFEQLISEGELATWWPANGLGYGIRWRELEPLSQGCWVVINGSRAHLPALRAQAPGLRAVEVSAPLAVLSARLAGRGREGADAVRLRLDRHIAASTELTVMNDGRLDVAVDALHRWWLGCTEPTRVSEPGQ